MLTGRQCFQVLARPWALRRERAGRVAAGESEAEVAVQDRVPRRQGGVCAGWQPGWTDTPGIHVRGEGQAVIDDKRRCNRRGGFACVGDASGAFISSDSGDLGTPSTYASPSWGACGLLGGFPYRYGACATVLSRPPPPGKPSEVSTVGSLSPSPAASPVSPIDRRKSWARWTRDPSTTASGVGA